MEQTDSLANLRVECQRAIELDTPRTDEARQYYFMKYGTRSAVVADFARTLERELAACSTSRQKTNQIVAQRDALRTECGELRSLLQAYWKCYGELPK